VARNQNHVKHIHYNRLIKASGQMHSIKYESLLYLAISALNNNLQYYLYCNYHKTKEKDDTAAVYLNAEYVPSVRNAYSGS